MFSMHTWSLGTLWTRNPFLIQLTGFASIFALFADVNLGRYALCEAAIYEGRTAGRPSHCQLCCLRRALSFVLHRWVVEWSKAPNAC
jgi:hypothetical protein